LLWDEDELRLYVSGSGPAYIFPRVEVRAPENFQFGGGSVAARIREGNIGEEQLVIRDFAEEQIIVNGDEVRHAGAVVGTISRSEVSLGIEIPGHNGAMMETGHLRGRNFRG
jgi:hypothetical protein